MNNRKSFRLQNEQGNIITVSHLSRSFRVAKREKTGLRYAVKSLIKREYVQVDAVNDVSFTVKKGEIRGLIGPNGAGKSTTIKIMSGILFPTSGEVNVMGYMPWLDREEYVRHIGVLFGQKSQLEWDLPAIDTFHLRKNIFDIPDDVYKRNLDYFEDTMNLSSVLYKPVRQLSLGERMKCEFVCAVLHEPPLVFLDEPTIGLDVVSKEIVRTFISQINRDKGTTIILTTHDLNDIENLCRNISVINKGVLVFNDSLEQLKSFLPSRKTISVLFESPVNPAKLLPFAPVTYDTMQAAFDIDTTETSVRNFVSRLFGDLPIADINIEGAGIEEIIRHIYTES
ncbi:MAG: ATP-binding cassette domain-containing protein [Eubacteriales bacterium]